MRTVAKVFVPGCVGLFLMLWASPLNAKVLDATGTWKVNMEKSDFGKEPKPKAVMVKVEHKEPALKYSVTGMDAEGKPINVEFDGAIDGKPYKEIGSHGGATLTYKRIDDLTLEGMATSADGKTTLTFTMVGSKDGKVSTMKVKVKGPEGEYNQLRVYERQ